MSAILKNFQILQGAMALFCNPMGASTFEDHSFKNPRTNSVYDLKLLQITES